MQTKESTKNGVNPIVPMQLRNFELIFMKGARKIEFYIDRWK
jgi:hypothetical protein